MVVGQSVREIIAAWVFCTVLGVASLAVVQLDHGRRSSDGAAVAAHMPGGKGWTTAHLSVADEFADDETDDLANTLGTDARRVYADGKTLRQQICWLHELVHKPM
jgi:hypothetical protein